MNESNTWAWLRDVALPLGHYDRIESPDTAPGFPDVHFNLGYDCSGCIELKYSESKTIPFPNEDVGLHKSQLKWFKKAVEWGANCWIIAEVPPSIYVIHGNCYDIFNGATVDQLYEMSVAVLYRAEEKNAPKILHNLLTTFKYDK